MTLLSCFLWAWSAVLFFLCAAALRATLRHYRPEPPGPLPQPFTLIKPIRGTDEGMLDNFRAIFDADPEGRLQLLFAMESEDDPAYAIARRAVEERPGRDAAVLLTGPSGDRQAKVHNMIEALEAARHPFVVFSDADIRTTRRMVAETSRAFASGAEAVFGIPCHGRAEGVGGVWYMIGFNHFFLAPAAVSFRLGCYRSFSGAWMGYSRRVLERIGGLEPLARRIADDYALGSAAAATGCRIHLMRELVGVREEGQSAREAFRHVVRWFAMGRWTLPPVYFALPWVCPVFAASAAALLGLASGGGSAHAAGWLGACALRAALGWCQDWRLGTLMPWYGYGVLAIADLGLLLFWAAGFKRELEWRGKRYRLLPGGAAEVL